MKEIYYTLDTSKIYLEYFKNIDDKLISYYLNNKIFIEDDYLYDKYDDLAYKYNKEYDCKKIASLVNIIDEGLYDLNFYFRVWNNGTIKNPILEFDENIIYHIKAFQYLKENFEIIVIQL